MTAWIYVLAFVRQGTTEIRFEHKVVMAADSKGAYAAGFAAAKAAGIMPPPKGESANDYVIELVRA